MRHNASPCPFGRGPPTTDHHSAFMEGSKTYAKRSILGSRFIACINPDRRHGRRRYRYRFRPVASQQVIAGAARSPVQRVSIVPDSSPADQLNRADVARAKRTTPLDLGRSSGWACPRGRLLVRQIRPAIGPELDVEFIDAMLVLAETCILFAGVISRNVFNSPIIWTDELATFLFLWLAMIGAVVALRHDGHMRLTTFANRVGPQWGSWLATIASLVLIVFVLEILAPAQ
jgi:hypothetical protein